MKALFAAAGLALAAPAVAHAEAACADLKQARLPHAEVTDAAEIQAGGKAACKVSVVSRPTSDSEIGIEVVIPRGTAWNGKYVQVGNGGLAGAIPSAQIEARAAAGYASAGTDDGHKSMNRSAAWALGHPEKIKDFAYRSLKETTDAAKLLIAAQKSEGPKRSYFVGCSAGGREALMEAQRYPADFDGIVAGAAANYNSVSTGGRAYMQQMLARPGGYLAKADLELLQAAALKQCAGGGPYIRDQLACRFDPGVLQCKAGQKTGCLTAAQVASARAIYNGRPDRSGRPIFPGFTPGAEAFEGGYQAWNTGPEEKLAYTSSGYMFSSNVMKYFIYQDPSFDFLKADLGPKYDRDRQAAAKIIDATDPDLTPFKKRGGKLIQYHGWNDPAIPPLGSIRYRDEMISAMGDTSGFYRLYMVPGMLHCGGGAGPNQVDWLALIDGWVDGGRAPDQLTATANRGATGTQLLCPYPGVAHEAGGAWTCRAPGGGRKGR
jgi:feruloyl esterase